MLAATLGSVHNLYFLASLVERLRQAILDGNFASVRDAFLARYRAGSAVA
jgi:queuine tRNA-ribosyltransferase